MSHHRNKLICVSPCSVFSEGGPQSFDEIAAAACETIRTLLLGRVRRPQRSLLSLQGG
jgi:hypothetical protein